jgi:hypothetical protein
MNMPAEDKKKSQGGQVPAKPTPIPAKKGQRGSPSCRGKADHEAGPVTLINLLLEMQIKVFTHLDLVDGTMLGLTGKALYTVYRSAIKVRLPKGLVSLSVRHIVGEYNPRLATILRDWFPPELVYSWHADKFVAPRKLDQLEVEYLIMHGCTWGEIAEHRRKWDGEYGKYID